MVDGGSEVEGRLDGVELGVGDVPEGWEVFVGAGVDDMGGGVEDGGEGRTGGEGDGAIEFGEVAGGFAEDAITNGDGCDGWLLVGVGGGLEEERKKKRQGN